ncbi:NAD(P)/FAD-dependent oxidoreductase [Leifsonia sp. F6_8S_P_1B]|uniref:NAD(P)/FAD-dependent oxidoreductase n=1 Tax=Leifsonia williamsii TaxID=3035919 RepID=A0ABT8KCJ7_9MICO|nr:NAD(P)/FAD-dependent oxidoreductase [Leifsonia williamsii]MDN4614054.1 NAD(P)/FAD-dependent oxidoreductase [Leifsonia williamsii]
MRRILVVGGGYAGFYTAWGLEKRLKPGEAEITVVDPRPYMTYQPFLPEVAAGSIEARHAAVSLRSHLRRTRLVHGTVTRIEHARHAATVQPPDGEPFELGYDIVVVTAGAVTRTFPIPGVTEQAIGMKHVEEAIAIRDRLLDAFDRASLLPAGPERSRLLTVAFVGGGFSGVEGFAELLSLATALLRSYPELRFDDLSFHLVEARDRILPEVTDKPGEWVVRHLVERGARIHLGAQLLSAEDGHIVLSTGEEFDAHTIVWTAGNGANPVVANNTDLPVTARGSVIVRADLRVGTADAIVPDAWAAGDDAAVPDLASAVEGAITVPNAQHAVRQGRLLAKNIAASIRGGRVRDYVHHSLGVVATLGLGKGIFEWRGIVIKGFPAWVMHRGYHVLAIPTWERKVRVALVWATALLFGRDIVSLLSVQHPRQAFLRGGRVEAEAATTVPPRPAPEPAAATAAAGAGSL